MELEEQPVEDEQTAAENQSIKIGQKRENIGESNFQLKISPLDGDHLKVS